MSVYSFNGFVPVIKESSFVHPKASVTGNVIIGEDVYIGPGAAIRGDWGQIIIEDGCNVQENCTIHMFPGTSFCPCENFFSKTELNCWKSSEANKGSKRRNDRLEDERYATVSSTSEGMSRLTHCV